MGGTNVNDVCVAPDTMVHRMEVDPGHLAFGKERLDLPHCHGIVLGIVECEVTNLNDTSDGSA
jgi:hypothetical protein